MKENSIPKKGQILVIFVIALIGLLAFLALILDGGNLFTNKRIAQNGADAGAMAGALKLCLPEDYPYGSADLAAVGFADLNDADVIVTANNPKIEPDIGRVTLTTTVTSASYFAHLIGFSELSAQAIASADCCPATSGKWVLPIAWRCRPPVGAEPDDPSCEEKLLDEEDELNLEEYIENPTWHEKLYIIVSSASMTEQCLPDGTLKCDLDGDGKDDIVASGDRGWVDLHGVGGGVSELKEYILNGIPIQIMAGNWVAGKPGDQPTVFSTVYQLTGEIVQLPVFNKMCEKDPFTNQEYCGWETYDEQITETGPFNYRIVGFVSFFVTCVDGPTVKNDIVCPGRYKAEEMGLLQNSQDPTIEGFFVPQVGSDLGGGDCNAYDTGTYSMQLSR